MVEASGLQIRPKSNPTPSNCLGPAKPEIYYSFDVLDGNTLPDEGPNDYWLQIYNNPGLVASDAPLAHPSVRTDPATDLTFSSAQLNAEVTDDGGDPITARGFCWDRCYYYPDLSDNVIVRPLPGTGTYSANMTFLSPQTTYHVRAYATNDNATAYGDPISFTTPEEPVPDPPGYCLVHDGDDHVEIGDYAGLNFSGTAPFTFEAWVRPDTAGGTGTILSRFDEGVAEQYYLGLDNGSPAHWFTGAADEIRIWSESRDESEIQAGMTAILDGTESNLVAWYAFDRTIQTSGATVYDDSGNGNDGTTRGDPITSVSAALGVPYVKTERVDVVSLDFATLSGRLVQEGASSVVDWGFCYNTRGRPVYGDSRAVGSTPDSQTGLFDAVLKGLSPGVIYFARAYAVNGDAAGYGDQVVFTPVASSPGNCLITDIPDQTFSPGYFLKFSLFSDHWGTGENLDIVYGDSVAWGTPAGTVTLDPATGKFRLQTPEAQPGDPQEDWRPFALVFTATANEETVSQTVVFNSGYALPREYSFVESGLPVPDEESDKYIVRNEKWEEAEPDLNFNWQPNPAPGPPEVPLELGEIEIAGKTLVTESGHENGIYDDYHGKKTLSSMTLYAETVIIRDPWHLPQTNVSIHARTLRFEGDGWIDTVPEGPGEKADNASYITDPDTGEIVYDNGEPTFNPPGAAEDGPPGGNLELDVGELITGYEGTGEKPVRFLLAGGRGQDAGNGLDGIDGASVDNLPNLLQLGIDACEKDDVIGCSATDNCAHITGFSLSTIDIVYCHYTFHIEYHEACGVDCDPVWPTSGTDAVASGRPGTGGHGGIVTTSLTTDSGGWPLAEFTDNDGGEPGAEGTDQFGGIYGTPVNAVKYRFVEQTIQQVQMGISAAEFGLGEASKYISVVPKAGKFLSGGLSLGMTIGQSVPLPLDMVGQVYEDVSTDVLDSDYPAKADEVQEALGVEPMNLKQILERAGAIAKGLATISYMMGDSEADPKDTISALNKLRGTFPFLSETISDTIILLEQKLEYGRLIEETMDEIASLPNKIAQNQLAVNQVELYLSQTGNVVLDGGDMVYLSEMERRARERLIRYHYYMVKAYEYRMLAPYDLTRPLDDIL